MRKVDLKFSKFWDFAVFHWFSSISTPELISSCGKPSMRISGSMVSKTRKMPLTKLPVDHAAHFYVLIYLTHVFSSLWEIGKCQMNPTKS